MEEKFEIVISGDSMYPFLQNGEKVKVQAVDPSSVVIGDIIIYIDPTFDYRKVG